MSAIHEDFARLYYHLHPKWTENLSHQSVRILQTIQMTGAMTVKEIANRFRFVSEYRVGACKETRRAWVYRQTTSLSTNVSFKSV